ncbi:hypothetical protein WN093_01115 [Gammaproteobacteria bacterium AS21]|mgnify:CR=1 FL=1
MNKKQLLSQVLAPSRKLFNVIAIMSAFSWQSYGIASQQEVAVSAQLVWSVSGFDQPESTVYLPDSDTYLVSNINGAPMELNAKGYISKVSSDGKILDRYWSQGFDAPKGMGYFNGQVYVADMQQLIQLDAKTGTVIKRYFAPSSKMLNDVAIDNEGNVFVSDLIAGGIYKLADGKFKQWMSAQDMPHPNGLTFNNNSLIIASWGRELQADFSTKTLGRVSQLPSFDHLKSEYRKTLITISDPIGNLDGIERFGDYFITNDWINGKIFAVKAGRSKLILEAGKGAADINIVNNQLFVPMMMDNRLDVYRLNSQ